MQKILENILEECRPYTKEGKLAGNPSIELDEAVYVSEKATGNKNRALAYMLKAYGLIHDDVESVLEAVSWLFLQSGWESAFIPLPLIQKEIVWQESRH